MTHRFTVFLAAAVLLSGVGEGMAAEGGGDALPLVAREIRAQVTARVATTLSSPMAGRIRDLSIEDGDRFKQGEVLVRFDCAVQEGQHARAVAVLEKNRQLQEVNERLRKLGSVSVKEMNVSHADVATAAAEAGITRAMVDRCTVTAPFAGRVAGVSVKRYQFIGEGQPMLDILDDKQLELEAIIPSRWLAWLGVGTGFQVEVDETGKTYQAKVSRLSGRVDPVSQSVKIYASITGASGDLLPGMSGRALISPPENTTGGDAKPVEAKPSDMQPVGKTP
ncbi:efflux RND transporter periplasmic adaptor subunit [Azospirillum rugosum]|uniref:RND family efflux transporter MFP subunit n=1 Tax=Azospirillum rugosum TaxID=416170 RepID=A0ABS4SMX5_9PROT|nr:efflux RND transporter periplasmic adaptor subunit [Azospirillum rugosum]MBP2292735.1 RND family efflux transporter MFP subunit [Azospirillum rugosum]MDQ0526994.1 RND family efflux transporter MFP subunit [Azospirillum rugosum]